MLRRLAVATGLAITTASVNALPSTPLPHLERLTVEDGLAHSTVWAVHQDRQGFLWIATESFLQRYDGYQLVPFKHDPENPQSLSESQVTAIAEDRQGNLWFGTRARGVNRFDPTTERWTRFEPDETDPLRLTPGMVLALVEDQDGALWVGTAHGLNRLDPTSGRVTRYRHRPEGGGPSHDGILDLLVDPAGTLWVGSLSGLDRFDRRTGRFEPVRRDPDDPESPSFDDFGQLLLDARGALWVGTWDGRVHVAATPGGAFVTHDPEPDADGAPGRGIRVLREDRVGDVWIGSDGRGVLRFDRAQQRFERHAHQPSDPHSLASNRIHDVLEDRSGVLWFATNSGLARLVRQRQQITVHRYHPPREGASLADPRPGLPGHDVMALAEDDQGALWVGTLEDGVARQSPESGSFTIPVRALAGQWPHGPVRALLEDRRGQLWVGTGTRLLRLTASGFEPAGVPAPINGLLEASDGVVWAATAMGVFRVDTDGQAIHRFAHDEESPGGRGANRVYALAEDSPEQLWLASEGGLTRFEPATGLLEPHRHRPGEPGPSSDNVVALLRDPQGDLWIGSYGAGLDHWDRTNDRWRNYGERDGLPSDKIVSILHHDDGHLWLGTNGGLARLDPTTGQVRSYDADDGLHGNVFFIGSALSTRGGELVFGGPDGLTRFRPEQLTQDGVPPQVALTALLLRDEPVALQHLDPSSPLDRSIHVTQALDLDHRHETMTFEFAGLHYASPRRNRYAYRLVGYDDDWIASDATRRQARYTNLDPGRYRFEVKAANKDGVWSTPIGVDLRLRAAPWKTPWAFAIYGLAVIALALGLGRWQHRRLIREQTINQRLREVDRLKDDFLARTSHELRTPLMGITGLAESLRGGHRGPLPAAVDEDLAVVVSSGRRLGALVDDLLDFSRLQHQRLTLDRHPVSVHALTARVLTLLRPIVDDSRVQLENAVPRDLPAADGDEARLQQVLHNLVGNAIKFSESGTVRVTCERRGGELVVSVADQGPGIPADQHDRIFEAFEQGDPGVERAFGGTGLGLAVSRRLVELHGGRIWLESTEGQGATFFFSLPVDDGDSASADLAQETDSLTVTDVEEAAQAEVGGTGPVDELVVEEPVVDEPVALETASETAPEASRAATVETQAVPRSSERTGDLRARVLIVDDEAVNRRVLLGFLSGPGFATTTVSNGRAALDAIERQTFDLVLLDVMMPGMSGFEVCRALRRRHPITELPILFLTAKGTEVALREGLDLGANDYLVKPIGKAELLARLRPHLGLLRARRHLEALLQTRRDQVETLRGLLPVCSSCKKIRDDQGYWSEVETFLREHSQAELSHGLCPNCTHDQQTNR